MKLWMRPAAVALAAVIGAAAASCSSAQDPVTAGTRSKAGPAAFEGAQIDQRSGVYATVGQQVVFGATTIVNSGDRTVTLERGRLVGKIGPSEAKTVEVRVADLADLPNGTDLVGVGSLPSADLESRWKIARSIDGVTIGAGGAVNVVFKVEVIKAGDWYWPRTAVDYRVGDAEYTAETHHGFQICPPAPAECSQ